MIILDTCYLRMVKIVINFKIICPDCGAMVITPSPQAVVLEQCPACKIHVWDLYDALMADIYAPEKDSIAVQNLHAAN